MVNQSSHILWWKYYFKYIHSKILQPHLTKLYLKVTKLKGCLWIINIMNFYLVWNFCRIKALGLCSPHFYTLDPSVNVIWCSVILEVSRWNLIKNSKIIPKHTGYYPLKCINYYYYKRWIHPLLWLCNSLTGP